MTRFAAVLAACLLPSMAAAAVEHPFTGLRDGDTLWVKLESGGCFSSYRAEITILGREPDVAYIKLPSRDPMAQPGEFETRLVALTARDRRGLDRLIGFYRTNPRGGCTSVDRIDLSLSRNGRRIPSAHFVDGSCSAWRTPGVVRLDEVVWRQ